MGDARSGIGMDLKRERVRGERAGATLQKVLQETANQNAGILSEELLPRREKFRSGQLVAPSRCDGEQRRHKRFSAWLLTLTAVDTIPCRCATILSNWRGDFGVSRFTNCVTTMVSTRQHPEEYYPSSGNDNGIARSASKGSSTAGKKAGHTPSTITLLWLLFAIPLVLWDTVYVLLRPHTMPGGKLHSPFFKPYALYGSVDYTYGWPAYKSGHGFPAGQGLMNLFETLAYIFYVTTVYRYGTTATGSGRASTKNVRKGLTWLLFEEKVVGGRVGSLAVLIAFSASVATFSKTVLYCKQR